MIDEKLLLHLFILFETKYKFSLTKNVFIDLHTYHSPYYERKKKRSKNFWYVPMNFLQQTWYQCKMKIKAYTILYDIIRDYSTTLVKSV